VTASIATTTDRRRRRRSFFAAAASLLVACSLEANTPTWPSPKYQQDPAAFAEEILGVTPWSKQREILTAIARPRSRVAVASGHKVGKSALAALAALWFYCSYPDARVVMSSVTARQVDQILWREVKKMLKRAGRCALCRARDPWGFSRCEDCEAVRPIPEEPGGLARTGLRSEDFRELVGFTAKEAEAVAGISGANLLYVLDESSGIPDEIHEAIDGNRAGGARVLMISNPTRTEGRFFHAFHAGKDFWTPFVISSEDSPNVLAGCELIPGLASREWVDEMKHEWGEDSPLYLVRVKGKFCLNEAGKIVSLHAITEAQERWKDHAEALAAAVAAGKPIDETGTLQIGIDPAGDGEGGDETAMAVRRGQRIARLCVWRGLTEDAHVVHVLNLLQEHRRRREGPPIVTVDREGRIGYEVYLRLRAHAERYPGSMQVFGVRASDKAHRQAHIYDRARDELWGNLAAWLRAGGALLEDAKLEKEIHAPKWHHAVNGRLKATPKEELRKELGRSPDRADAVALAVWEPTAAIPDNGAAEKGTDSPEAEPINPYSTGINPYASAISPY
jgi:phage terminase large subunit